jgi:hypothetical protein
MRRTTTTRRRLGATAAVAAAVVALGGCGAPPYQFVTSTSDDVVIRLPRAWTVMRSGLPTNSDGTTPAAGSWIGVYDAATKPSLTHAQSMTATDPVAIGRTWVVSKDQGKTVTADDLRDLVFPVSAAGRSQATLTGTKLPKFALLSDAQWSTKAASGVHVVYTYVLDKGEEVFDQVAVTDAAKTRVHLFFVHCTRACFEANKADITTSVASFTVKKP